MDPHLEYLCEPSCFPIERWSSSTLTWLDDAEGASSIGRAFAQIAMILASLVWQAVTGIVGALSGYADGFAHTGDRFARFLYGNIPTSAFVVIFAVFFGGLVLQMLRKNTPMRTAALRTGVFVLALALASLLVVASASDAAKTRKPGETSFSVSWFYATTMRVVGAVSSIAVDIGDSGSADSPLLSCERYIDQLKTYAALDGDASTGLLAALNRVWEQSYYEEWAKSVGGDEGRYFACRIAEWRSEQSDVAMMHIECASHGVEISRVRANERFYAACDWSRVSSTLATHPKQTLQSGNQSFGFSSTAQWGHFRSYENERRALMPWAVCRPTPRSGWEPAEWTRNPVYAKAVTDDARTYEGEAAEACEEWWTANWNEIELILPLDPIDPDEDAEEEQDLSLVRGLWEAELTGNQQNRTTKSLLGDPNSDYFVSVAMLVNALTWGLLGALSGLMLVIGGAYVSIAFLMLPFSGVAYAMGEGGRKYIGVCLENVKRGVTWVVFAWIFFWLATVVADWIVSALAGADLHIHLRAVMGVAVMYTVFKFRRRVVEKVSDLQKKVARR